MKNTHTNFSRMYLWYAIVTALTSFGLRIFSVLKLININKYFWIIPIVLSWLFFVYFFLSVYALYYYRRQNSKWSYFILPFIEVLTTTIGLVLSFTKFYGFYTNLSSTLFDLFYNFQIIINIGILVVAIILLRKSKRLN
jgi:hypothetical protein